jgi:hypothetical protein
LRSWLRTVLALTGLLLLAGCARAPLETEADRTARAFFQTLHSGDAAAMEGQLAPGLVSLPDHDQRFERMRAAIPAGRAQEVRTVGWARTQTESGKRMDTVHLYRFPGADLIVGTALVRVAPTNGYRVADLVLNRVPPGTIERHRFRLSGKSPRQLGFLATTILSPLVMLGMAVLVIFTPGLKLKPLWFALCFVGVGSAYMNWTTGQAGFNAMQLSLINFGFTRTTDISPWIIRFSAPVGALVVLVRLLLHGPKATPSS